MNEEEFVRFLYQSESDSLDFKREQYNFSKASDEDKSELLKDIISMSNSWRKVDGHIILGIAEKAEKPNELSGISEHIDDATLQQFVNSKTNQICNFSYSTFTYDNATFGIIKIPVQKRPIYLKKDYGKLKKNVVYIRRGSSTSEANLEEISLMGVPISGIRKYPEIDINFNDLETGESLGKDVKCRSKIYSISDNIPNYEEAKDSFSYLPKYENRNYYREVFEYIRFFNGYAPLKFQLINKGDIEAKNIKLDLIFLDTDIEIKHDGEKPREPSQSQFMALETVMTGKGEDYFTIERRSNKITAHMEVGILHAKRDLEAIGTLYINPTRERDLYIEARVYCDGVDHPFVSSLKIQFKYKEIRLLWSEFVEKYDQ
ncbi:AlbA family DNA-binding domain-containing protein [Leptospira johnsonii]|uniref:Schlafen AlbA-2 domain-containing protein n=1 Tax=Leptospira johnsonii TaxID=1917820 RepID=A0A2P2D7M2_9LEPT|nr:ATP-binding protein [Leptospira johnsonii]GBF40637.1 hypothetical protein LPTSP1_36550 [Leptospira johnsonii]